MDFVGFNEWLRQKLLTGQDPSIPAPAPPGMVPQAMQGLGQAAQGLGQATQDFFGPSPPPPPPRHTAQDGGDPSRFGVPPMPQKLPPQRDFTDMSPYIRMRAAAQQRDQQMQGVVAQYERDKAIPAQAKQLKGLEENEQAEKANYEEYQQNLQEAQQRSNLLREEIRQNAQRSVDPGRFFASRDTWQKIAMGIALAVSGAMNPGGPNVALAAIERAIDRDIDAQKFDLERKDKALTQQANMLDRDINTIAQIYKTKEYHRAQQWEVVSQRFALEMAQSSDEEMAARAAQGKTASDLKVSEDLFTAVQKGMQATAQIKSAQIAAGARVRAAKETRIGAMERAVLDSPNKFLKARTDLMNATTRAQQQEAQKGGKYVVKWKDQVLGHVQSVGEQTRISNRLEQSAKVRKNIQYLLDNTLQGIEQLGDTVVGRGEILDRVRYLRARYSSFIGASKEELGLGARLDGFENTLLEMKSAKDIDTFLNRDPRGQLQAALDQLEEGDAAFFDSRGLPNPFELGVEDADEGEGDDDDEERD